MVSLVNVTKIINNNVHKQTADIIADENFEQKTFIPRSVKKDTTEENEDKKNEIVEIPPLCEKFIDKNNYYMYSSENFLHALLFSIDESFRLGVCDQKKKQLELIQSMLNDLNTLFSKNKQTYSKKGF